MSQNGQPPQQPPWDDSWSAAKKKRYKRCMKKNERKAIIENEQQWRSSTGLTKTQLDTEHEALKADSQA